MWPLHLPVSFVFFQFVKCGFAGDNLPRYMFPSMVGRPMLRAEEGVLEDVDLKDVLIGDEAAAVRQGLEISYPVDNGKVKNWDDMELLWNYIFKEKLDVDPAGKKIMLTEAPMNELVRVCFAVCVCM